jgi:CheY-like chemotaxis protein
VISNNKVKKILLVDDEPDVIYTIKNILEDNGFQNLIKAIIMI